VKILDSVIGRIPILVVDNFLILKQPADVSFHHQSVDSDVPSHRRVGMASHLLKDVTLIIHGCPPSPEGVLPRPGLTRKSIYSEADLSATDSLFRPFKLGSNLPTG
jgi:hypothetical protein